MKRLLKSYVELGLEAVRRRAVASYRVWLVARALDSQGVGYVPLSALRRAMAAEGYCSRQTLWRTLRRDARGLYTIAGRTLYYRAPWMVADEWDLWLSRHPVLLPPETLRSLGSLKRALMASWFAGKPRMISQETLGDLVARDVRTVHRYLEGVGRQANVMISSRDAALALTPDMRANGYFRTKVNGKWQTVRRLPNTYWSQYETTPIGNVKRRRPSCQSTRRALGRLYFSKPKAVTRAMNRLLESEIMYEWRNVRDDRSRQGWISYSVVEGAIAAW